MCDLEIIVILNVCQGIADDLASLQCMAFDLFKFVVVQTSRFIQDNIRYLDLADIVKRCRFIHQCLKIVGENILILRKRCHILDKDLKIFTGAFDMLAGAGVS